MLLERWNAAEISEVSLVQTCLCICILHFYFYFRCIILCSYNECFVVDSTFYVIMNKLCIFQMMVYVRSHNYDD